MADNLEIAATIKAILDERGFSDYNAAIKKQQQATQDFRAEADRLGYSFDSLKNQLLGMVAATAVLGFFKESITVFADAERAIGNFEAQMRAIGPASEAAIPKFRGLLEALGAVYHLTDDQLYPSFNRILLVTGDAASAMGAMTVAARFARAGLGDVESLSRGLALVLQGSARAARNFGVDVQAVKEAHGDVYKIIDMILEKYDKLGTAEEDTKAQIEANKVGWHEFGEVVGKSISWIPGALNNIAYGLHMVTAGVQDVIRFDFGFAHWKRAIEEIDKLQFASSDGKKKLDEDDARSALKAAALRQSIERHTADYIEHVEKEIADDEENSAKKAEEDEIRVAEMRVRTEEDTQRAIIAASAEGSKRKMDAELSLLNVENARRVAAVKGNKEALLAIERWYRAQLDLIEQKHIGEVNKAAIKAKTDKDKKAKHDEDLLKNKEIEEGRIARIKEVNDGRLAQHEQQMSQLVYDHAMSLGDDLFGKSKAWNVAKAIMDTWSGVNGALSMTPWTPYNFVLAALVAAEGLANVATIEGVSLGFDDPMNDALAEKWGRKSAQDFIEHSGRGFAEELGRRSLFGGAQAAPTVINRTSHAFNPSHTTNVTINGFIGAGKTDTMMQLKRQLDLIDRQKIQKTRIGR